MDFYLNIPFKWVYCKPGPDDRKGIPLPLIEEAMNILGYGSLIIDCSRGFYWATFAPQYGDRRDRFPHKLFLGSDPNIFYIAPNTLEGFIRVGYKSGKFKATESFCNVYRSVCQNYTDKDKVVRTLRELGCQYEKRVLSNLQMFCIFRSERKPDEKLRIIDLREKLVDLKTVSCFVREEGVRKGLFTYNEFDNAFKPIHYIKQEPEIRAIRDEAPDCSPYSEN